MAECNREGIAGLAKEHLDDTLVSGRIESECLSNFFSRLIWFKAKDKYKFSRESLEYLCHMIYAQSTHKSEDKIAITLDASRPTDVSTLT